MSKSGGIGSRKSSVSTFRKLSVDQLPSLDGRQNRVVSSVFSQKSLLDAQTNAQQNSAPAPKEKSVQQRIVPRPIPDHSLRYDGDNVTKIQSLSQIQGSAKEKKLKFNLVGLSFSEGFRGRIGKEIPNYEKLLGNSKISKERKSRNPILFSEKASKLFYQIKTAKTLEEIFGFAESFGMRDLIESFNKENSEQLSSAPFSLYKYALLEEFRLITRQAGMLEKNKGCLKPEAGPNMTNGAMRSLEWSRGRYQDALNRGSQYANQIAVSQAEEFQSNGVLRNAYLDPALSPFVSSLQGIALLDPELVFSELNEDQVSQAIQFLSAKETEEFNRIRQISVVEPLKAQRNFLFLKLTDRNFPEVKELLNDGQVQRSQAMLSVDQFNAAKSIDEAIKRTHDGKIGGKAELRIPTGGGKSHLLRLISLNYGGKIGSIESIDLNTSRDAIRAITASQSLKGKTYLLDEAFFYSDFGFFGSEVERNNFIRGLREKGATVIISGASESLAKIKIEMLRLEDKIGEITSYLEEQEKRTRVLNGNKGSISVGTAALDDFKRRYLEKESMKAVLDKDPSHNNRSTDPRQKEYWQAQGPKAKQSFLSIAKGVYRMVKVIAENSELQEYKDLKSLLENFFEEGGARHSGKESDVLKVKDDQLSETYVSLFNKLRQVAESEAISVDFSDTVGLVDSSERLGELERRLEVKRGEYEQLSARRDGLTIDRIRREQGYRKGFPYEQQSLSETVSDQITQISGGKRRQYILPGFEISDENCSEEDLRIIQEKSGAEVITIPYKGQGGSLRHRAYYRDDSGRFVFSEPKSLVSINRFLEQECAGKSSISFFDKRNFIGGDYIISAGIDEQILHADFSQLTTNQIMQAHGRNRGGEEGVNYVFVNTSNEDLTDELLEGLRQRSQKNDVDHVRGYLQTKIAQHSSIAQSKKSEMEGSLRSNFASLSGLKKSDTEKFSRADELTGFFFSSTEGAKKILRSIEIISSRQTTETQEKLKSLLTLGHTYLDAKIKQARYERYLRDNEWTKELGSRRVAEDAESLEKEVVDSGHDDLEEYDDLESSVATSAMPKLAFGESKSSNESSVATSTSTESMAQKIRDLDRLIEGSGLYEAKTRVVTDMVTNINLGQTKTYFKRIGKFSLKDDDPTPDLEFRDGESSTRFKLVGDEVQFSPKVSPRPGMPRVWQVVNPRYLGEVEAAIKGLQEKLFLKIEEAKRQTRIDTPRTQQKLPKMVEDDGRRKTEPTKKKTNFFVLEEKEDKLFKMGKGNPAGKRLIFSPLIKEAPDQENIRFARDLIDKINHLSLCWSFSDGADYPRYLVSKSPSAEEDINSYEISVFTKARRGAAVQKEVFKLNINSKDGLNDFSGNSVTADSFLFVADKINHETLAREAMGQQQRLYLALSSVFAAVEYEPDERGWLTHEFSDGTKVRRTKSNDAIDRFEIVISKESASTEIYSFGFDLDGSVRVSVKNDIHDVSANMKTEDIGQYASYVESLMQQQRMEEVEQLREGQIDLLKSRIKNLLNTDSGRIYFQRWNAAEKEVQSNPRALSSRGVQGRGAKRVSDAIRINASNPLIVADGIFLRAKIDNRDDIEFLYAEQSGANILVDPKYLSRQGQGGTFKVDAERLIEKLKKQISEITPDKEYAELKEELKALWPNAESSNFSRNEKSGTFAFKLSKDSWRDRVEYKIKPSGFVEAILYSDDRPTSSEILEAAQLRSRIDLIKSIQLIEQNNWDHSDRGVQNTLKLQYGQGEKDKLVVTTTGFVDHNRSYSVFDSTTSLLRYLQSKIEERAAPERISQLITQIRAEQRECDENGNYRYYFFDTRPSTSSVKGLVRLNQERAIPDFPSVTGVAIQGSDILVFKHNGKSEKLSGEESLRFLKSLNSAFVDFKKSEYQKLSNIIPHTDKPENLTLKILDDAHIEFTNRVFGPVGEKLELICKEQAACKNQLMHNLVFTRTENNGIVTFSYDGGSKDHGGELILKLSRDLKVIAVGVQNFKQRFQFVGKDNVGRFLERIDATTLDKKTKLIGEIRREYAEIGSSTNLTSHELGKITLREIDDEITRLGQVRKAQQDRAIQERAAEQKKLDKYKALSAQLSDALQNLSLCGDREVVYPQYVRVMVGVDSRMSKTGRGAVYNIFENGKPATEVFFDGLNEAQIADKRSSNTIRPNSIDERISTLESLMTRIGCNRRDNDAFYIQEIKAQNSLFELFSGIFPSGRGNLSSCTISDGREIKFQGNQYFVGDVSYKFPANSRIIRAVNGQNSRLQAGQIEGDLMSLQQAIERTNQEKLEFIKSSFVELLNGGHNWGRTLYMENTLAPSGFDFRLNKPANGKVSFYRVDGKPPTLRDYLDAEEFLKRELEKKEYLDKSKELEAILSSLDGCGIVTTPGKLVPAIVVNKTANDGEFLVGFPNSDGFPTEQIYFDSGVMTASFTDSSNQARKKRDPKLLSGLCDLISSQEAKKKRDDLLPLRESIKALTSEIFGLQAHIAASDSVSFNRFSNTEGYWLKFNGFAIDPGSDKVLLGKLGNDQRPTLTPHFYEDYASISDSLAVFKKTLEGRLLQANQEKEKEEERRAKAIQLQTKIMGLKSKFDEITKVTNADIYSFVDGTTVSGLNGGNDFSKREGTGATAKFIFAPNCAKVSKDSKESLSISEVEAETSSLEEAISGEKESIKASLGAMMIELVKFGILLEGEQNYVGDMGGFEKDKFSDAFVRKISLPQAGTISLKIATSVEVNASGLVKLAVYVEAKRQLEELIEKAKKNKQASVKRLSDDILNQNLVPDLKDLVGYLQKFTEVGLSQGEVEVSGPTYRLNAGGRDIQFDINPALLRDQGVVLISKIVVDQKPIVHRDGRYVFEQDYLSREDLEQVTRGIEAVTNSLKDKTLQRRDELESERIAEVNRQKQLREELDRKQSADIRVILERLSVGDLSGFLSENPNVGKIEKVGEQFSLKRLISETTSIRASEQTVYLCSFVDGVAVPLDRVTKQELGRERFLDILQDLQKFAESAKLAKTKAEEVQRLQQQRADEERKEFGSAVKQRLELLTTCVERMEYAGGSVESRLQEGGSYELIYIKATQGNAKKQPPSSPRSTQNDVTSLIIKFDESGCLVDQNQKGLIDRYLPVEDAIAAQINLEAERKKALKNALERIDFNNPRYSSLRSVRNGGGFNYKFKIRGKDISFGVDADGNVIIEGKKGANWITSATGVVDSYANEEQLKLIAENKALYEALSSVRGDVKDGSVFEEGSLRFLVGEGVGCLFGANGISKIGTRSRDFSLRDHLLINERLKEIQKLALFSVASDLISTYDEAVSLGIKTLPLTKDQQGVYRTKAKETAEIINIAKIGDDGGYSITLGDNPVKSVLERSSQEILANHQKLSAISTKIRSAITKQKEDQQAQAKIREDEEARERQLQLEAAREAQQREAQQREAQQRAVKQRNERLLGIKENLEQIYSLKAEGKSSFDVTKSRPKSPGKSDHLFRVFSDRANSFKYTKAVPAGSELTYDFDFSDPGNYQVSAKDGSLQPVVVDYARLEEIKESLSQGVLLLREKLESEIAEAATEILAIAIGNKKEGSFAIGGEKNISASRTDGGIEIKLGERTLSLGVDKKLSPGQLPQNLIELKQLKQEIGEALEFSKRKRQEQFGGFGAEISDFANEDELKLGFAEVIKVNSPENGYTSYAVSDEIIVIYNNAEDTNLLDLDGQIKIAESMKPLVRDLVNKEIQEKLRRIGNQSGLKYEAVAAIQKVERDSYDEDDDDDDDDEDNEEAVEQPIIERVDENRANFSITIEDALTHIHCGGEDYIVSGDEISGKSGDLKIEDLGKLNFHLAQVQEFLQKEKDKQQRLDLENNFDALRQEFSVLKIVAGIAFNHEGEGDYPYVFKEYAVAVAEGNLSFKKDGKIFSFNEVSKEMVLGDNPNGSKDKDVVDLLKEVKLAHESLISYQLEKIISPSDNPGADADYTIGEVKVSRSADGKFSLRGEAVSVTSHSDLVFTKIDIEADRQRLLDEIKASFATIIGENQVEHKIDGVSAVIVEGGISFSGLDNKSLYFLNQIREKLSAEIRNKEEKRNRSSANSEYQGSGMSFGGGFGGIGGFGDSDSNIQPDADEAEIRKLVNEIRKIALGNIYDRYYVLGSDKEILAGVIVDEDGIKIIGSDEAELVNLRHSGGISFGEFEGKLNHISHIKQIFEQDREAQRKDLLDSVKRDIGITGDGGYNIVCDELECPIIATENEASFYGKDSSEILDTLAILGIKQLIVWKRQSLDQKAIELIEGIDIAEGDDREAELSGKTYSLKIVDGGRELKIKEGENDPFSIFVKDGKVTLKDNAAQVYTPLLPVYETELAQIEQVQNLLKAKKTNKPEAARVESVIQEITKITLGENPGDLDLSSSQTLKISLQKEGEGDVISLVTGNKAVTLRRDADKAVTSSTINTQNLSEFLAQDPQPDLGIDRVKQTFVNERQEAFADFKRNFDELATHFEGVDSGSNGVRVINFGSNLVQIPASADDTNILSIREGQRNLAQISKDIADRYKREINVAIRNLSSNPLIAGAKVSDIAMTDSDEVVFKFGGKKYVLDSDDIEIVDESGERHRVDDLSELRSIRSASLNDESRLQLSESAKAKNQLKAAIEKCHESAKEEVRSQEVTFTTISGIKVTVDKRNPNEMTYRHAIRGNESLVKIFSFDESGQILSVKERVMRNNIFRGEEDRDITGEILPEEISSIAKIVGSASLDKKHANLHGKSSTKDVAKKYLSGRGF